MSWTERLKQNPRLKALALSLLIPTGQARPRLWVRLLVNPWLHPRGRGAVVGGRARLDVLPFRPFEVGAGAVIEDYAVINNGMGGVYIGERSFIGLFDVLIGPLRIGADVLVAQHVVFSGLNHGYEDVQQPIRTQTCTAAEIVIEDDVWIGANAVVTAGVRVGRHSVVAAGSVVTRDVPPYSVVGGNPARIIKQYDHTTQEWVRGARPVPATSL